MRSKKYGVVALLDALGTKGQTIEQAGEFIEKRDKILNEAKKADKDLQELLSSSQYPFQSYTFGDTVILTWEGEQKNAYDLAAIATCHLCFIIADAIAEKVFFRGAIAIGEYICDTTSLLGPAIFDAAGWYEEADWSGLIFTPHAGYFARGTPIGGVFKWASPRCYSVPLRGGRRETLWTINWPWALHTALDGGHLTEIAKQRNWRSVEDIFRDVSIPKGTESKYFNTVSFYRHIVREQP